VDGWAVTLLSEKHRGFGSTCQTVGLYLGHSISFNFFLSMNSVEFCNAYLRSEPQAEPFWTLGGFLYFWAVAFVAVTLFVARGVPERSITASGARHGTAQRVRDAYVEIMRVMRLPSVLSLCLVLITSRLAFAVTDNISLLRMQHKGLAPETIGVLATLQLPFDIFFSALAGAFGARSRLGLFTPWLRVYVPRLALSLAAAALVWLMPERAPGHATAQPFGWGFLALTFSVQVLYSFCSTVMFVTQSAFFSSVSDERIGGSYMTLLNTVANLANQIGKLFIFALVDAFSCVEDACPLGCDPYYAFSLVFAALGVAWFVVMRGRIAALQRLPKSAWRVPLRSSAAAYSSK
jgi:PAT family acetyl-CoA transporter-like MFS transporter 1